MGKQHNRRIFTGVYKQYKGEYIYGAAVVPQDDAGGLRRLRKK